MTRLQQMVSAVCGVVFVILAADAIYPDWQRDCKQSAVLGFVQSAETAIPLGRSVRPPAVPSRCTATADSLVRRLYERL